MFVPLAHPPSHAQADFGDAIVVIDRAEQFAADVRRSRVHRPSGVNSAQPDTERVLSSG